MAKKTNIPVFTDRDNFKQKLQLVSVTFCNYYRGLLPLLSQ
jgi:hypothetical protein